MGHDPDLSSPVPWRRSLRASRARRRARVRRRRLALSGRAGVMLAVAGAALAAAGAPAQEPAPPSGAAAAPAGAQNATVSAIQQALGLPADGVYGRHTRAAVRRFQRAHGLMVDGIAGPQTLAALGLRNASEPDAASPEGPAASPGPSAASTSPTLQRIAQCESGGDPTAVSPDGQYRGKYQFDRATWERLGGTGDPAQASEAEQDRRAAQLLAQSGTSPWPACG